jgi:hypothetical protein
MLTDEPDLHLMAGGQRVEATERYGQAYLFRLDASAGPVRLCSRAASPAELGTQRDPRILGVAVSRITVWQGDTSRVAEASDPRLVDGYHPYEPNDARRWTNGEAAIPLDLLSGFEGPLEVVVHLTGRTFYPLLEEPTRLAA